jgi:hypothetical protein
MLLLQRNTAADGQGPTLGAVRIVHRMLISYCVSGSVIAREGCVTDGVGGYASLVVINSTSVLLRVFARRTAALAVVFAEVVVPWSSDLGYREGAR